MTDPNPYGQIHREGLRDARNHYEVDHHGPEPVYEPRHDADLDQRTGKQLAERGSAS